MIRLNITYGAAVWYNTTNQNKVLLGIPLAGMPMHNRCHENLSYRGNGMLDLTPLHLTVQGAAEAALFRMAKNGVGGATLLKRRTWTSLSKNIPHLTYPKEKTVRKFNFGSTFFTKSSNKRE